LASHLNQNWTGVLRPIPAIVAVAIGVRSGFVAPFKLLRVRIVIALACLATVPVAAAVGTSAHAGGSNGTQGGLFGGATYSALNQTTASLASTAPLLLAIVVALLASAIASTHRDWAPLRYLYVAPVGRARPLSRKLAAWRSPPPSARSASRYPECRASP
jgi:hypothetical protein